ncbi:Signal transduction histidine kinase [Thermomonospora echinospora]|uniref:Signal transduction histidine kinase n=1 Tax=Thermomonospora echinospora TaxID=1992 RepID=A0A1H5X9G3_9ACTN|nr:sensor histidine kinase [Thermomonospora echinospora]SEG08378.1 Signal transduction histidine kinase [Thermomonospora echinospora]
MATIQEQWERFYRWGPFGLLSLATFLALLIRELVMSPGEQRTAAPLILTAVALQIFHVAEKIPGHIYYWTRTVLAFALSWLNPFYSVYAVLGYFDAPRYLTRRWARAGTFATAVTLAGAQAGGLPPESPGHVAAFGGLLALNSGLVFVIGGMADREAEQARVQEETIAELERTNARLEQALAENAALQAQLIVQAREAGVSDERRRLAAEIHDTIAQGLTGIIAQLQAAEDGEHVRRATDLARESLREARRSVRNLAPTHLEHDSLPEALKKITDGKAHLTVTGTAEPLHDELEAALLRIAQEAVANATRHAHAERIGVTLSYMDDEVTLDIRDDGRGFTRPTRGFGLTAMRERAERVAGTLEIESEPGRGTAVSARVPLIRHG